MIRQENFLEQNIEWCLRKHLIFTIRQGGGMFLIKDVLPRKKLKKFIEKRFGSWIEAVTGTYKDRTPSITYKRSRTPRSSLVMQGARKKYASQKAATRPTKTVYIK